MKSVFLTGATGFIGRQCFLPLLRLGFHVHAIYHHGEPCFTHQAVNWHLVDLHDSEATRACMMAIRPTHLLHLAWYAKPKVYWEAPENLQWFLSSVQLLEAFIAAKGKRALFIGTCAEYDWQSGWCQEYLTRHAPTTLYGRSKHYLSLVSEYLAGKHHLSFAWARLFFLFGPHEHQARLVPHAITTLLSNQRFQLMNGFQERDFLYVLDAADALAHVLHSEAVGAFNIGSGQAIGIQTVVEKIGSLLGTSSLIDVNAVPKDKQADPKVLADVSRLKAAGWSPKYTLEAALLETIGWWRANLSHG